MSTRLLDNAVPSFVNPQQFLGAGRTFQTQLFLDLPRNLTYNEKRVGEIVKKWEPDGQGTLFLKTSDGYEAAIWKVDKDKVVNGNHWKINIMSPDDRVVLDGLDPPRTQTRSDAKDYSIGRINFDKACLANPIYRTATRKED